MPNARARVPTEIDRFVRAESAGADSQVAAHRAGRWRHGYGGRTAHSHVCACRGPIVGRRDNWILPRDRLRNRERAGVKVGDKLRLTAERGKIIIEKVINTETLINELEGCIKTPGDMDPLDLKQIWGLTA